MYKRIMTLLAVVSAAFALAACDRSDTTDTDDGPAEQIGQAIDQSVDKVKQEASQFADSSDEYTGEIRDAWIDGKVEGAFALNRHLNPITIDTHVENGVVRLDGEVESDIDRDLAGQIAMSIEGVVDVENRLQVRAASESGTMESKLESGVAEFRKSVDDMTTTAVIKSRLLANENTRGLSIDVDTDDGVVTLTGTVATSEEKDLAGSIAANARYVVKVNNELQVDAS